MNDDYIHYNTRGPYLPKLIVRSGWLKLKMCNTFASLMNFFSKSISNYTIKCSLKFGDLVCY